MDTNLITILTKRGEHILKTYEDVDHVCLANGYTHMSNQPWDCENIPDDVMIINGQAYIGYASNTEAGVAVWLTRQDD